MRQRPALIRTLLLALSVGISTATLGQDQSVPVSLAYQSHQTATPFTRLAGLIQQPVHSGVVAGTAFPFNTDTIHRLRQTAKLGYLYHSHNQKAVQLYSELAYQFHFADHWSGLARLGLGYMHSFPDVGTFTLNGNGRYEATATTGRPQAMLTSSLGVQYHWKRQSTDWLRLRLTYQPWLQYPFVKEYVPLLPYSALSLSIEKSIQWQPHD